MANPKKQTPWVVEMGLRGEWYPLDAFATEKQAMEMLPVYRGRVTQCEVRVRNIFTTPLTGQ